MKTIIILILWACPILAFSQSMSLPGASLQKVHKKPGGKLKTTRTTDTLKADGSDISKKLLVTTTTTEDETPDTADKADGSASKPYKYRVAVLNTNFTVPLMRVNFLNNKPQNASNSIVSASFLNSAGAGLTYSWGELDQTIDPNGNVASTQYYNHFGFHLGFLFAANTASGTTTTTSGASTTSTSQSSSVFAILGGISVLNMQLGLGYELGSLPAGQKRVFFTLAYAIPISSLIKGGYKIYHPIEINNDNP